MPHPLRLPASLPCPAKINVYLRLVSRRDDGYHEIESLFLPVSNPSDVLELDRAAPGAGLAFTCSDPGLPVRANLVTKAYEAFAAATGFRPDLAAHLTKRTPSGAGLGGGSSDAAVMLRTLNALAGERALAPQELNRLAAGLGADIPFFLQDRPAWVTGIGEGIEPLGDLELSGWLLLAFPDCPVPTARAYGLWDELVLPRLAGREPPGTREKALARRGLLWRNDFEEAVFPHYAPVAALKADLLRLGARAAVMSGSGATVAALFARGEQAEAAAARLERQGVFCFASRAAWGG